MFVCYQWGVQGTWGRGGLALDDIQSQENASGKKMPYLEGYYVLVQFPGLMILQHSIVVSGIKAQLNSLPNKPALA